VPAHTAAEAAHLPPVGTLFAAFLGNNPIQHLLDSSGTLATLPAHNVAVLTGTEFFPRTIAEAFSHGLVIVFTAAAAMAFVAAFASFFRGAAPARELSNRSSSRRLRSPGPQRDDVGRPAPSGAAVRGVPASAADDPVSHAEVVDRG
jgi:hypothetical protein